MSCSKPNTGDIQMQACQCTTRLTEQDVLADPLLNKGTAFTEEERDELGLHGLLPPNVMTMEEQVARRMEALRALPTDFDRYLMLRELQDSNETLYFAVITQHIEEMLPVIYTPTVGAGCQRFSHSYRKPRGLFLSLPHKGLIRKILANPRFDSIEAIVVTDGERILGLGDQGAGGMGIPIGKMALYTACGGLHPATTLPITLDVGTDNAEALADPLYIGWRHPRVRGAEYDEFIDEFVSAVKERWPNVLLQWEDFHKTNASRLLEKYRDQLCTFNDDVQGTAAVATGTLLAAINVTGVPMTEQRVIVLGGGSAGCGIAALIQKIMVEAGLTAEEAASRFYVVGRKGLMIEGKTDMDALEPFQRPYVQKASATAGWVCDNEQPSLLDVVKNAKPTVMIGVSGQAGSFTEEVVREMARHAKRPVIFPLSNPTANSEATPADLVTWTEGRVVIGTGSPFPPIDRNGKKFKIDQTNNSYIFPGVGVAALALKIPRVTDSMFVASAKALAAMSPARKDPEANLLPPVSDLRLAARAVAIGVGKQAMADGLIAPMSDEEMAAKIDAKMWVPVYPTVHLAK